MIRCVFIHLKYRHLHIYVYYAMIVIQCVCVCVCYGNEIIVMIARENYKLNLCNYFNLLKPRHLFYPLLFAAPFTHSFILSIDCDFVLFVLHSILESELMEFRFTHIIRKIIRISDLNLNTFFFLVFIDISLYIMYSQNRHNS